MIDHQHLRLFSSVILSFLQVHLVILLDLKHIFNEKLYMILRHLLNGYICL